MHKCDIYLDVFINLLPGCKIWLSYMSSTDFFYTVIYKGLPITIAINPESDPVISLSGDGTTIDVNLSDPDLRRSLEDACETIHFKSCHAHI